MSSVKKSAEIVELGHSTVVVLKHEGNSCYPNTVITIDGHGNRTLAVGIVKMFMDNQCPECGKFNGQHGEVFHVTDMNNGEVNGNYKMCSHGGK
jgi:hypothetical protein